MRTNTIDINCPPAKQKNQIEIKIHMKNLNDELLRRRIRKGERHPSAPKPSINNRHPYRNQHLLVQNCDHSNRGNKFHYLVNRINSLSLAICGNRDM